jgi:hypothetical protein
VKIGTLILLQMQSMIIICFCWDRGNKKTSFSGRESERISGVQF